MDEQPQNDAMEQIKGMAKKYKISCQTCMDMFDPTPDDTIECAEYECGITGYMHHRTHFCEYWTKRGGETT